MVAASCRCHLNPAFNSMPVQMFTPFHARTEPALELAPSLHATERFLARLFLRRYVAWCASHG